MAILVRKYVYDGDPPDGGIPANHVVSLSPQQQRNYGGEEFLMAGFNAQNSGGVTFEQNRGKANEWVLVRQPSGTVPGYFDGSKPGYKVISWRGTTRPSSPLYGVVGTESEGVEYDRGNSRFFIMVPQTPDTSSGGSTSTPTTDPYSTGGTPTAGDMAPKKGKELTILRNGRIWYATTKKDSGSEQGPHPGLSLAGPDTWNSAEWGTPASNGLPAALITADDPDDRSTIRPATKEFRALQQRAANGDESALMVFQDLDLPEPEYTKAGWIKQWF